MKWWIAVLIGVAMGFVFSALGWAKVGDTVILSNDTKGMVMWEIINEKGEKWQYIQTPSGITNKELFELRELLKE